METSVKLDPNYQHAHKLLSDQFFFFSNATALYMSKRADILQKVKSQDLTQKTADAQIAELAKAVDSDAKGKMSLIDRCESLLLEQLHSKRELKEEALDPKDLFKLKNLWLEASEVQEMIDKHQASGNITMLRLLKKHCLDHNIKIKPYSLKDGSAQFAELIEDVKKPFTHVRTFLKKWNGDAQGKRAYNILRFNEYFQRYLPETLPPISLSKYWGK